MMALHSSELLVCLALMAQIASLAGVVTAMALSRLFATMLWVASAACGEVRKVITDRYAVPRNDESSRHGLRLPVDPPQLMQKIIYERPAALGMK